MDSIERLARKIADMYKENRNPSSNAPRICTVVNVDPLRIQWGQNIVIDGEKIFLPRIYHTGIPIPNRYQTYSGGMVEEQLTLKIDLQLGDRVMVAPDETLQNWYLIDLV